MPDLDPNRSSATLTDRGAFADTTEELSEYRPVSFLAIASAIVGLLSIVANFQLVLLVIPIAGIILAMVAIREIDAPDTNYIGRRFAVIGLALSIFFGAYALSRTVIVNKIRANQAAQVAKGWVDIVRSGNLPQAAEWMKPAVNRQRSTIDLAEHYSTNEDAVTFLKAMQTNDSVRRIIAVPKEQEIDYHGLDGVFSVRNVEMYDFFFELPPRKGEDNNTFICTVRRDEREDRVTWIVAHALMDEPEEE